ncbi:MAG: cation transporter [Candidatus Aminicenantes bacterium]|nr:MAG: cation transporter [Candidatus Aminicenantes bacterium]RLE05931.1 MAG: cation transporter [Candidatus Aminicenantes bacterium]
MKKAFIKGTIIQFLVLAGLWLILSGKFDYFHVTIGFLSAALVTLVHLRLNHHLYFRHGIAQVRPLRLVKMVFYIPWLTWQIILASLQVAYVVLHPKIPINPSLIKFRTKLPNVTAKVILGNSITLTPGTLTIRIDNDEFIVHALMDASATSIIDGSLPFQVAKLYQRRPSTVISEVKILRTTKGL